MNFYDEAMKWRQIAKALHKALGAVDCYCVETQEYVDYRILLSTIPTPAERLAYSALHPFEGIEVEEECPRCTAMFDYEQAVGDENIDIEMNWR